MFSYLFFWDGYYHEESNQPSSSSGSVARMLFDQYRQERFFAVNEYETHVHLYFLLFN
jgi:hypothetical protein